MGEIIHLASRAPSERVDDRASDASRRTYDCSLADLMSQWIQLITSSVAEPIYDLGGTDDDVRRVAEAAALAMFSWSAGDGIRG